MSRMKEKQAVTVFLGLIVIILFYMSSSLIVRVQGEFQDIQRVRLDNSPISQEAVEDMVFQRQMSGEYAPMYTAWRQEGAVTLENEELNRMFKGTVVYYCGDNRGQYQLVLDNGCALTQEAAYALWGTGHILGESVQIGGQEYIVERLLPVGNANIVKCKDEDALLFNVLDVYVSNVETEYFKPEEIILANQLTSSAVIDCNQLIGWMQKLSKLPLWIAAVMLAFYLGRLIHRAVKHRMRTLLAAAASLAVLTAAYLVLGAPITLPQAFVPTKWSDFSFWSEAFSAAVQNMGNIVSMQIYEPDAALRLALIQIVLICALQSVLLVYLLKLAVCFAEERSKRWLL